MNFKIYRTSGKPIKHPKCKLIDNRPGFRDRMEYEINIETLEELFGICGWLLWDNPFLFHSTLEPMLLLKSPTEIEIYDTYRE